MKTKNLFFLFAILITSSPIMAQTYAITGNNNGDNNWTNIRQFDISTGNVIKDVLVPGTQVTYVNVVTNQVLSASEVANISVDDNIAAAAYSLSSNKLFYATMHTGQLRWINFNNPGLQVNVLQQQFATVPQLSDQPLNITRMCINADGNGYALTNDASHLYRFTTGNTVTVTDLGGIVDAESNTNISVLNQCTSWGGDLIADAYGNLYLITAHYNVFEIDANSRIATYLGAVKGLPAAFTSNGAVVDADGNVILAGAQVNTGVYKVNLADLTSAKISGSETNLSISDLANSNLLYQNEVSPGKVVYQSSAETNCQVYPNPVSGGVLNIAFDNLNTGSYTINISDPTGKVIYTTNTYVATKNQVQQINLGYQPAAGIYFVNVIGSDKQNVYSGKIVIQ